ncbi:hypothetical protein BDR07DRAFT_896405 [Suillus spraguei]|nr:hypothetical protein BDR07DRAFT_896405 [Suillus spraguei]
MRLRVFLLRFICTRPRSSLLTFLTYTIAQSIFNNHNQQEQQLFFPPSHFSNERKNYVQEFYRGDCSSQDRVAPHRYSSMYVLDLRAPSGRPRLIMMTKYMDGCNMAMAGRSVSYRVSFALTHLCQLYVENGLPCVAMDCLGINFQLLLLTPFESL